MVVFNSLIESTYNCLKTTELCASRLIYVAYRLGITLNPRRITIKFPSALVDVFLNLPS